MSSSRRSGGSEAISCDIAAMRRANASSNSSRVRGFSGKNWPCCCMKVSNSSWVGPVPSRRCSSMWFRSASMSFIAASSSGDMFFIPCTILSPYAASISWRICSSRSWNISRASLDANSYSFSSEIEPATLLGKESRNDSLSRAVSSSCRASCARSVSTMRSSRSRSPSSHPSSRPCSCCCARARRSRSIIDWMPPNWPGTPRRSMCSNAMSGPSPSRMSSLSESTSLETERSSVIGVCVPSQRE